MHPHLQCEALQPGLMHKNTRVNNDNHIPTTTTNTTNTMLLILALIIATVLSTQTIAVVALIFLFREMT